MFHEPEMKKEKIKKGQTIKKSTINMSCGEVSNFSNPSKRVSISDLKDLKPPSEQKLKLKKEELKKQTQ